jgi:hypothetical protein
MALRRVVTRCFDLHGRWGAGWLFALALLVGHAAHARPSEFASANSPASDYGSRTGRVHRNAASNAARPVTFTKPETGAQQIDTPAIKLSPAAWRVSQIASRNGDRQFVMVDKAHGKIFLFEDGMPIFSGSALTGESLADRLPPDASHKPLSRQNRVEYNVTPAGRFTMTRAHDDALGDTFDINELQGLDWRIAIHRVWLGKSFQHRDERLLSANDQDKHITEGCIDVDMRTVVQLYHLLPNSNRTAIYILPIDERLITDLFY